MAQALLKQADLLDGDGPKPPYSFRLDGVTYELDLPGRLWRLLETLWRIQTVSLDDLAKHFSKRVCGYHWGHCRVEVCRLNNALVLANVPVQWEWDRKDKLLRMFSPQNVES